MSSKLAFFMVQFSNGGVEKLFHTLVKGLSPSFSSVDVVACNGKNASSFDVSSLSNVHIHDLRCRHGHGDMYTAASLFRLMRYLKRETPDVLIASPGYCGVFALLARWLTRSTTKVILSVDDKISAYRSQRWYHRLLFHLCLWLYPKASGIVVPFQNAKDDILKIMRINEDRVHVIPHPVINEELLSSPYHPFAGKGELHNKLKILFVGRLYHKKGIFTLLDAFLSVVQCQPSVLFVVGDGPQRQAIQDYIKAHHLTNQVFLMGYCSNPYPYYRHCDLFVLPSHIEPFGMVIAEALSTGCPVVATRTPSGGAADILDQGKYGILCRCNDPKDLYEKIIACHKYSWNKDVLRARGMHYSIKANIAKYQELIESLC